MINVFKKEASVKNYNAVNAYLNFNLLHFAVALY